MRVRVRGKLGKIRLHVQVDFGFGDVIVPKPVPTELPQLLDLGAPRLLGYTPESTIAEKFQAMVALDIANTRIKDFYDIWSLSRGHPCDFQETRDSVAARRAVGPDQCFQRRPGEATHMWQAFLRKGRLEAEGYSPHS